MPTVQIRFRDKETGDEAVYQFDTDRTVADDIDDCEGFYWTDGNGACDCERARVLNAALGRPDPHVPCGDSRIVILSASIDGLSRPWEDDTMKAEK